MAVKEHSLRCQTEPESDKTLGVVRDPIQRLYFTWRYFKWDKTGPTLEDLTRNIYRMYEREKLRELEFHLRPQSEFMIPLAPNTLIKFEEVDEFFAGIDIHLRPKQDNFPAECDEFFTMSQLDMLHTAYKEDFELWGRVKDG